MLKFLSRAAKWYEQFGRLLAFLAGVLIIIMAISATTEGIARYAFNAPTSWAYELNINLLLYFAFLGGAFVMAVNAHVKVDVLYSRWSARTRAAIDMVTFLLPLAFIIILIWGSIGAAQYSLQHNLRSLQAMHWPLWPLKVMIPVGAGLLGVQLVIKIIRDIHVVVSGTSSKQSDAEYSAREV